MKFQPIQLLWRTDKPRDGTAEERSEARFRTWILAVAMLAGPPLLLYIYYRTMVPGLTNPDALDYAQIGRNLSAGRGFVTSILRPLALTHGGNPLAQPDVTHGPLYPFLLALSFGVLGVNDRTVAIVSGVFYLLTIPVIYFLGDRVFNRAVGLLATIIFALNALMLEYATSGLPITLYVFLTTCLLLVVYNIAAAQNNSPKELPRGQYLLAGLLLGLLYLTDPIFIWLTPFVVAALVTLTPGRKVLALVALLTPLCLLMLPWMARNAALTGNPIFGLRGIEIWMNTKGFYPGLTAYRQYPGEIAPGAGAFKAVVAKMLLGTGQIVQAFPQVTASWILAFFLPCLLFKFSNPATNSLRRVMMLCLLGLVAGSLVFRIQMPLLVAVIPTMLTFSVAYLLNLTKQAKLRTASLVLVAMLVAIAICFPLLSDMTLIDKPSGLKEARAARSLSSMLRPDEIAISDQPWTVAWHADRSSLWIPINDAKISDLRKQFPTARWLFLTDGTRAISPQWASIYDGFSRWNSLYAQAVADRKTLNTVSIDGTGFPLLDGLNGFTSVAFRDESAPSVVVAAVPIAYRRVGLNSNGERNN